MSVNTGSITAILGYIAGSFIGCLRFCVKSVRTEIFVTSLAVPDVVVTAIIGIASAEVTALPPL